MAKLIKLFSKGKERMIENLNLEQEDEINTAVIQHELVIPEIERNLTKWSLPKLEISNIYKTSIKDMFSSEYVIKTVEKEITLNSSQESIALISPQLIAEHIKKYRYLHIGSIQLAIKPLHRKGINTRIKVTR